MSAQLIVTEVAFSHGPAALLDGVTFTVDGSTRAGIVGPNGSGKSTLLRLLCGDLQPDRGTVVRVPADATVSLQHQVVDAELQRSARDWLAWRSGFDAATADLDAAARALAAGEEGADDRYDRLLQRYLAFDPSTFDARVEAALERGGLADVDPDQVVSSMSGGQRTRLQLAALDLLVADVLLLDEPTNDLDADGLATLERMLADRVGATVVVSHDRAFLEGFVDTVLEIDPHAGSVTRDDGGFEAWQQRRRDRRRHAEEAYSEWAGERAALRQRASRDRQWSRTGVARVKRSGEPDRSIRAQRLERSQNLGSRAARTDRELERLERRAVEKPWEGWELRLDFAVAPAAGVEVARLDAAVLERGRFRLGPVDVTLTSGDRVLVRGPNGGGKTTLLDALLGRLPPVAGAARLGPGAIVGVLRQGRDTFGDRPLLDAFCELAELPVADARSRLAKLGLGPDHVARAAPQLSPGEQTRAILGLFAATGVNTLVLDEPTNHLDLEAIEQLEAALDRFPGTVVLVTHDRRLAEAFRATREWVVGGGGLRDEELAGGRRAR